MIENDLAGWLAKGGRLRETNYRMRASKGALFVEDAQIAYRPFPGIVLVLDERPCLDSRLSRLARDVVGILADMIDSGGSDICVQVPAIRPTLRQTGNAAFVAWRDEITFHARHWDMPMWGSVNEEEGIKDTRAMVLREVASIRARRSVYRHLFGEVERPVGDDDLPSCIQEAQELDNPRDYVSWLTRDMEQVGEEIHIGSMVVSVADFLKSRGRFDGMYAPFFKYRDIQAQRGKPQCYVLRFPWDLGGYPVHGVAACGRAWIGNRLVRLGAIRKMFELVSGKGLDCLEGEQFEQMKEAGL